MAISSGVGPHFAWVKTTGGTFPLEHGSATQNAQRKSSQFSGTLPLYYPGARAAFANLGENTSSVIVSTRGQEAPLVTGEILTVEFDYIVGNIRFTGHDMSDKLHGMKSSEKWNNKTGQDIVKDLAGRAGLGFQGSVSSGLMAGKKVFQDYAKVTDGMSFSSVIHKLAEFDGARWWVNGGGVLMYMGLTETQGVYTLNYNPGPPERADFTKLSVKRNIPAGKDISVKVQSWNPKLKQVFEHITNIGGSGGKNQYTYHIPNLLMDHVQQKAKSKANEAASHELKVVAECVGDPTINPAMGLSLSGTDFDQLYQIEEIHHEFGMSGHTMTIHAKSSKGGRSAS
jgi:hypothetical protein